MVKENSRVPGPRTPKTTRNKVGADLPIRLTVVRPPADVLLCVQGRPGELLQQTRSNGGDVVFNVTIRVAEPVVGSMPRLLGEVVQGPPSGRFLYVCAGTYAGDPGSCWARRAKIPLARITSEQVVEARRR